MSGPKPFSTIDEMITTLESRGLKCDENTASILRIENYYSLINGHKDLFLVGPTKPETYAQGTTFNEVYNVYLFDRVLRHYILNWLMTLEGRLQTVIAHKSSEFYKDDPEFYLRISTYRNDKRTLWQSEKTIRRLTRQYQRSHQSLDHYRQHHKMIPFWVLVQVLTFGELSHFYSRLRSRRLRQVIASEFNKSLPKEYGNHTPENYGTFLRVLSDFRNICAHNERFYCHIHPKVVVNDGRPANVNYVLTTISTLLPEDEKNRFLEGFMDIYSSFITVRHCSP